MGIVRPLRIGAYKNCLIRKRTKPPGWQAEAASNFPTRTKPLAGRGTVVGCVLS